ncbi:MAG: DUF4203 domain-containing protein [bacterium]
MIELVEGLKLPEDSLILLVLGIAILLFGQRFVVFLIGVAAFYITAQAAKKYFGDASRTTVLVISSLAGIAAGVFTKMFRNIAVGIAGYTIAGFVLSSHASSWGIKPENERFVFVIGGVIGSLIISFALDVGLRLISSVLGSVLIVQYFQLEEEVSKWLTLLLSLLGFFIQSGILQALKKGSKKPAGGK